MKRIFLGILAGSAALLAACGSTPAAAPSTPASPSSTAPASTAASVAAKPAGSASTKPAGSASTKPAVAGSTSPAASGGSQVAHVKLGIKPGGISDAGIYLALEKGYFKDQNIELEQINFDSAARMIAPLGQDQIDVAAGATSAGFFNAFNRQIPIKIVADKGSQPPGRGYEALVVRKDLVDSGKVKDVKDLKGLKVAVGAKDITDDHVLSVALEKAGLAFKDIDLNEVPFPSHVTALANKSIDAAWALEPFVATIVKQGTGVRLKGGDEVIPNEQTANVLYGPAFAKTDAAKRWMVAYLKGVRDFNDALDKGKNRDEVVGLLQKVAKLDDATVKLMVWPGLDGNGKIYTDRLDADQDFYVKEGLQKQKVDIKEVIDTSFLEAAIKELGEYK
jgi:NitT/TauT family transport system substrate-binding protein